MKKTTTREIAKLEARWVELNEHAKRLASSDSADMPVIVEMRQAATAEMLEIGAQIRALRAAEMAEQGGVGFIGEVHGIRQIG